MGQGPPYGPPIGVNRLSFPGWGLGQERLPASPLATPWQAFRIPSSFPRWQVRKQRLELIDKPCLGGGIVAAGEEAVSGFGGEARP